MLCFQVKEFFWYNRAFVTYLGANDARWANKTHRGRRGSESLIGERLTTGEKEIPQT